MKAEVNKAFLSDNIIYLSSVASSNLVKNDMLKSVLFNVTEDKFEMFATDAMISISITKDISEETKDIKVQKSKHEMFSANVLKIKEILSQCEDNVIMFKTAKKSETYVELISDNVSHKIIKEKKDSTLGPDSLSALYVSKSKNRDKRNILKMTCKDFFNAVRESSFCTREDDRYGFSSLLIHKEKASNNLLFSTTDFRRTSISVAEFKELNTDSMYLMIPNKTFRSILKFKKIKDSEELISIEFDEGEVSFSFEIDNTSYKVNSPLSIMKHPKFIDPEKISSQEFELKVLFDTQELMKTLKRLRISNDGGKCCITVNKDITNITVEQSPETKDKAKSFIGSDGIVGSKITSSNKGLELPFVIKVRLAYWIDVVEQCFESEIEFCFAGQEKNVATKFSNSGIYMMAPMY